MVSRDGAFGILIGAAVGTLFLVPAHGSAQNPYPISCVSVDIPPCLEALVLAAEQGDANAQYSLGMIYANGGGVPKVNAEAVLWYRMAAEQGDDRAQYNLGVMYANGEGGLPQDDTEAARWYRISAEQGHFRAQYNLGVMYANGDGVPADRVSAYLWWNLSAIEGHEIARGRRDIIERQMTREQIAEAQRLSRQWIETHPPDGGN